MAASPPPRRIASRDTGGGDRLPPEQIEPKKFAVRSHGGVPAFRSPGSLVDPCARSIRVVTGEHPRSGSVVQRS